MQITFFRLSGGFLLVLASIILKNAAAFISYSNNHNPHHDRNYNSRHLTRQQAQATPIDPSGWPEKFPAKDHCSRCGLCETSFVSKVTEACAFLGEGMARMDHLEEQVHGRTREVTDMVWSDATNTKDNISGVAEEARFGVLHQPVMLAKGIGIEGAQWTGCVTGIALSMLESGLVDAAVCIANQPGGEWSSSEPIIAKTPEDVLRGRGVKPALAPSLKVLDQIRDDPSIKKLLFCGVGCAVQAFRHVENDLGLDEVFVLGTNCADNSPTPEAAKKFIKDGVKVESENIKGYEFMQDFKVHVKYNEDDYVTKPYFVLPGSIAQQSIATSCLACFDYTNGLADVVVGYMGAPLESSTRMDKSLQTLTIRNKKGSQMVQTALDNSRLRIEDEALGTGSHEKIASATVVSDSIVLAMLNKEIREEGMPRILGEIMAFAMKNIGPKGVNFARYSIDYHIIRNYLHVLDEWGEERAEIAVPKYAKDIVNHYFENDKAMADLKSELLSKRRSQAKIA